MPRILFEKTGNAVWISHLDLMRLFQRAFKRAGLPLKHTQGFNPRPSVSIALPLSVGVESECELLDFELDTAELITNSQIVSRLNKALVEGIRVRDCYDDGGKLRDLAYLRCKLSLEYDRGSSDAVNRIRALLSRPSLTVPKKTKNGVQEQDIVPMILDCNISEEGDQRVVLDIIICCQNPTLNPMQIVEAIRLYQPDDVPDFAICRRISLYDRQQAKFR